VRPADPVGGAPSGGSRSSDSPSSGSSGGPGGSTSNDSLSGGSGRGRDRSSVGCWHRGSRQRKRVAGGLASRLWGLFLFFNPLTEAGICKAPASVKRLTEAGKATVSVIHGLTVTFGRRRMLLPVSDNEKRPPRLSLL
jgi:hypothetical protein